MAPVLIRTGDARKVTHSYRGLQVADAPLARQSGAASGKLVLWRRRVQPTIATIHLIDGPARGGFSDSLRKGFLFFRYAEEFLHYRFLVSKQGIDLGVALPTCRVGFGIFDGELQSQRIRVRTPVTLYQVQLLAVGMPISIEPALVIQSDRVDDKSISLPLANGIAHPGGFRVLGMTPPVGPDLAPDALVFEEHENAVGSLHNLKWLGPVKNSRDTGRIAAQDRVSRIHTSFRAVSRLRGVVLRLGPRRHRRRICARSIVDALTGNSPTEEFIHAGQVVCGGLARFLGLRRC